MQIKHSTKSFLGRSAALCAGFFTAPHILLNTQEEVEKVEHTFLRRSHLEQLQTHEREKDIVIDDCIDRCDGMKRNREECAEDARVETDRGLKSRMCSSVCRFHGHWTT